MHLDGNHWLLCASSLNKPTPAESSFILAVELDSIVRADLDGSNQQLLASGLGTGLSDIDYDYRYEEFDFTQEICGGPL
jgi:hypothetical protein